MDAAGHLKRYGWQGVGHSLDLGGKGLVKPLLVSHKSDNRGIGQKKTLVSDQWWMRAFDESLKDLGTGKKTTLGEVQKSGGIKRNGLYSFFVKGEGLAGTITPPNASNLNAASHESSECASDYVTAPSSPDGEASARKDPVDESKSKTKQKRKYEIQSVRQDKRLAKEIYKRRKLEVEDRSLETEIAQTASHDDSAPQISLPERKLARYRARAVAKGVSIGAYIIRRREKREHKRDERAKKKRNKADPN